ncbi:hypothetical protein GOBAR_AA25064 [Gossypium barbadense]|uniref:Cytochrome P450 n=1 Tax=Gossypium barbadense TaxID=3634 RepID=A0A2P5WX58_GOSBA|nr:hypothetical protein GOBAR_AA25064 [Gossypium barbadense]
MGVLTLYTALIAVVVAVYLLSLSFNNLRSSKANIYSPIYKHSIGQTVRLNKLPHLGKTALAFFFGGKHIAFTPYGPEWCMLGRIFVHEMQSDANLDAFYALRGNQVKKSVGDMYGKNGIAIDVGLLAFSTVINMITNMFWGGTLEGDIGANINAQFRDAVSGLLLIWGKPNISEFFPYLACFDIQGFKDQDTGKSLT